MDAAPYYAPTYFPASYFYSATASTPGSTTPGVMPYNPPTYFAPSYFYGATTTTATTGMMPYDAPTYFAPSYFYGASSSTVVVPDPVGGDQEAYQALLALLMATGVFEDVIFGAATQRGQAGADTYPLAVLTPRGWEESDEFDPKSIVRLETFSITIVVTSQDALPQFDLLDRLSYAIKMAVDGSDLDGTCMPALTKIRSGRYVYSNHYPEQSIDLEGEFSSIINPATS
jgi:hypothetical protein